MFSIVVFVVDEVMVVVVVVLVVENYAHTHPLTVSFKIPNLTNFADIAVTQNLRTNGL